MGSVGGDIQRVAGQSVIGKRIIQGALAAAVANEPSPDVARLSALDVLSVEGSPE